MLLEPTLALKRDRENCTVFVSELSPNASEQDLRGLFKDVSICYLSMSLTHLLILPSVVTSGK